MIKLLEDWSGDALDYLTQFSWIDDATAEEILKIAKERIPSGQIVKVLDTLGNLIFKSLKEDKGIQNFLADHPNFGEPTTEEYKQNGPSIDAMFDEMESCIEKVVQSLNLGQHYQRTLSPIFGELEPPKVEVKNWDDYLWLIEIEFPKTGIEISNQFAENLEATRACVSRIGIDLSLKADLGDMTYYTVDLENGTGDYDEWAYGSDTRISEIVKEMPNNLREAVRVLKLRDLMKPLVRNENQFVKTVEAMYHVKSMT